MRQSIVNSLVGECIRIVEADRRMLVYYCNTLILELDPATKHSTLVERFVEKQKLPSQYLKDLQRQTVYDLLELDNLAFGHL